MVSIGSCRFHLCMPRRWGRCSRPAASPRARGSSCGTCLSMPSAMAPPNNAVGAAPPLDRERRNRPDCLFRSLGTTPAGSSSSLSRHLNASFLPRGTAAATRHDSRARHHPVPSTPRTPPHQPTRLTHVGTRVVLRATHLRDGWLALPSTDYVQLSTQTHKPTDQPSPQLQQEDRNPPPTTTTHQPTHLMHAGTARRCGQRLCVRVGLPFPSTDDVQLSTHTPQTT